MTPADAQLPRLRALLLFWGPVALWMAFIFWMSTGSFSSSHTSRFIVPLLRYLFPGLPEQDINNYHGMIRKIAHMFEYYVLGMLLFRAFRSGVMKRSTFRAALYSFAIVVLYALSDEFHQSFSYDRTASIIDVGFDALGGGFALCCRVAYDRVNRSTTV